MSPLGSYLGRLREERGLSIEELARLTRVAPRYLEALEHDDFTALPAPVFTKGYIRAYCQALDVPGDEALARYSETAQVAVATAPVPAGAGTHPVGDGTRRSGGTLLISFGLLIGFGLALFVVALLLQSGRPEVGAGRVEPPSARLEAKANPIASSPAPPPSAAPVPVAPSPPAAASPATTIPPTVTNAPASAASPPAPAAKPAPIGTSTPGSAVSAPANVAKPTPAVTGAPGSGTGAPSPVASAPTGATSGPTGAAAGPAALTPGPSDSKSGAPADGRPTDGVPTAMAQLPPLRLGGVASPYRLVARTQESTWLRVRTEDGRATEETIPAGEVREWISNRPFMVTIGNAGGIALELNGQRLPPLGGRGVPIFRLILPPPEP